MSTTKHEADRSTPCCQSPRIEIETLEEELRAGVGLVEWSQTTNTARCSSCGWSSAHTFARGAGGNARLVASFLRPLETSP